MLVVITWSCPYFPWTIINGKGYIHSLTLTPHSPKLFHILVIVVIEPTPDIQWSPLYILVPTSSV
jgi:hypothetical protein